jgi:hypothetical protein
MTTDRYLTGDSLSSQSAAIHEEYRKWMAAQAAAAAAAPTVGTSAAPLLPVTEPLLLTVDTELKNMRMSLKGYLQSKFTVGDRVVMSRFELAPVDFHATTQEKIGGTHTQCRTRTGTGTGA